MSTPPPSPLKLKLERPSIPCFHPSSKNLYTQLISIFKISANGQKYPQGGVLNFFSISLGRVSLKASNNEHSMNNFLSIFFWIHFLFPNYPNLAWILDSYMLFNICPLSQGSTGIRQWPINWNKSPMLLHKIIPSVDYH